MAPVRIRPGVPVCSAVESILSSEEKRKLIYLILGYLSGRSAGEARHVWDVEVVGSNPTAPTRRTSINRRCVSHLNVHRYKSMVKEAVFVLGILRWLIWDILISAIVAGILPLVMEDSSVKLVTRRDYDRQRISFRFSY